MVARLGGDEFAVLAPDASAGSMRSLADSVLAALRDLNHEGVRVTASVGVGRPTPTTHRRSTT